MGREGIKIASSQEILARMNYFDSPALHDIGSHFRPLVLARELAAKPSMVRFMPSTSLILFDCPSEHNSALNFSDPTTSDDTAHKHRNSRGRAPSVPAARRRGSL